VDALAQKRVERCHIDLIGYVVPGPALTVSAPGQREPSLSCEELGDVLSFTRLVHPLEPFIGLEHPVQSVVNYGKAVLTCRIA
jgi:hypothetical protein